MKFKNIFFITIILLTVLSISAISANDTVDNIDVDLIATDLNSVDVISADNINEESLICEDAPETGVAVNATDVSVNATDATGSVTDDSSNTTDSSIKSADLVKYYKNDTQYTASFFDADGNPVVNQKVQININGGNYTRTTNSTGSIMFPINLNPGIYALKVTNPVTNESAINNITVLSTLKANDVVKSFKNDTQYYLTVLDGQGNPLANANVTFNINGVMYERKSNASGIAKLNLNLNSGKYIITAIGPNGLQVSNNITILSTIYGKDIKKYYRNGTQYYANFTDSQGNPLANSNVTFNINGVMYTRTTNANGTAKLNINLNSGKYILTAINPVTTEQMSNTVEVLNKIVLKNSNTGGNISMEYNTSAKYTVALYEDNGTLAKNKEVKFNINGVMYTRTSNENGTASLTINLRPGNYVITAEFEGCKLSNIIKVRITPTVKLVSANIKYGQPIQFYLHEKNSGNPITGQHYGILYFNGTTYGAYPDANGLVQIGQQLPVGFKDTFLFGTIDDEYYSSILSMNTITIVE